MIMKCMYVCLSVTFLLILPFPFFGYLFSEFSFLIIIITTKGPDRSAGWSQVQPGKGDACRLPRGSPIIKIQM